MGIGVNIKKILAEKGKTLVWLGEETGISKYTLYGITRNPNIQVRPKNLQKIAKALNVSTEILLSREDVLNDLLASGGTETESRMEVYVFERMYRDFCKRDKTALAKELIAYKNIEDRNRGFANRCQAGEDFAKINAVFNAINELKDEFSHEKLNELIQLTTEAESSWRAIKSGVATINTIGRSIKEVAYLDKLEAQLNEVKEC